CLRDNLFTGWLGRSRKPSLRACENEMRTRLIDALWQTTRTWVRGRVHAPAANAASRLLVKEGCPLRRPRLRRRAGRAGAAEASDRAVGTPPPAGGEIDRSAAGSGQYDGRSRCAWAVPAMSSPNTDAQTAPSLTLPI